MELFQSAQTDATGSVALRASLCPNKSASSQSFERSVSVLLGAVDWRPDPCLARIFRAGRVEAGQVNFRARVGAMHQIVYRTLFHAFYVTGVNSLDPKWFEM